MTREEEIKEAAKEIAQGIEDWELAADIEDAFIEGAWWAGAHPHWISVEDELPKEHEWILGFSLKRSYIDVYNFDSNGLLEAHDITHWMHLPQPPRGRKRL